MDAEYDVEKDGTVKAFKIVEYETGKPYEVKPTKHKGAVPKVIRGGQRWTPMYTYLESLEVGTSECLPLPTPKESNRAYTYIKNRYKEGTIEVGKNGNNGVVFKIKKKLVLVKS